MSVTPKLIDSSLTLDQRIATLTFERDDVRNALTGTGLTGDILTTADWVNHCREVSVLIITGGGKAFSSGGNIKDMRDKQGNFGGKSVEIQEQYRHGIQRIPLAMDSIEVPVIAAVNGAAIGAGFDLCNMCDIRIGCPETLLGETFINLGIIPGDGGAWFLQRVVGYQRAVELSLTGRMVKAEEALAVESSDGTGGERPPVAAGQGNRRRHCSQTAQWRAHEQTPAEGRPTYGAAGLAGHERQHAGDQPWHGRPRRSRGGFPGAAPARIQG